jgi:hypothetical protein
MIKIGDKVKTKSNAWQRIIGFVVALHPETTQGYSAGASVYAGGYESIKVPLAELERA